MNKYNVKVDNQNNKGIAPQKGATPLVNRNLNNNFKFKNIYFILLILLIAEKQCDKRGLPSPRYILVLKEVFGRGEPPLVTLKGSFVVSSQFVSFDGLLRNTFSTFFTNMMVLIFLHSVAISK